MRGTEKFEIVYLFDGFILTQLLHLINNHALWITTVVLVLANRPKVHGFSARVQLEYC
jgi:hypothetical protein